MTWLTVSVAVPIVQLPHSHPMYEHMMNGNGEFHLKLLVFDIVVFLFSVSAVKNVWLLRSDGDALSVLD